MEEGRRGDRISSIASLRNKKVSGWITKGRKREGEREGAVKGGIGDYREGKEEEADTATQEC